MAKRGYYMNQCPHCLEETISDLEKFSLGPATSIRCSNCNNKITVPWWPYLIMALLMICIYYISTMTSSKYIFALAIIVFIGYFYILVKFVPLIKRKENGYF
jgi:hypothetical protein